MSVDMSRFSIFISTFSFLLLASCASQGEKNLFIKIADESLALGNSDAAINFYDKAIADDPKNIHARSGRVEALINIGKLDMATQDINIGLKINPKCESLIYSKGKIYLLRGNVNQACKIFQSLPKNFKALNALGTIYDAERDHKTAQEYYKKAIEINDQYADAYSNLGLSIVLSGGDMVEGIEYLERSMTLPGASQMQKNNLALAYGLNEDYQKALSIYEETMPPSEAAEKVSRLKKLALKRKKNDG